MSGRTTVFYRDELARRLGVGLERLRFEIAQSGRLVSFEVFVDGKDLTEAQKVVLAKFIEEHEDISLLGFAGKA